MARLLTTFRGPGFRKWKGGRTSTFEHFRAGTIGISLICLQRESLFTGVGRSKSDRPTYRGKPESLQGLFRWGGTFGLDFRPSSRGEARVSFRNTEANEVVMDDGTKATVVHSKTCMLTAT